MTIMIDLIMLLTVLPVGLIIIAIAYPKDWRKKKIFYGIRNREEYLQEEIAEKITALCNSARKKAMNITVDYVVIGALIVIFHDMPLNLTLCVLDVFLYIYLLLVPFAGCNKGIKSLKREYGLNGEAGVKLTDIKAADTVRTFKPVSVLIPCALLLANLVFSLLVDLKVISIDGYGSAGTFSMTVMAGILFLTGLLMLPVGILFDRLKNEVISEDSVVNANYNRALKKCMTGIAVSAAWALEVLSLGTTCFMMLFKSEILYVITTGVFMGVVIASMFVYMFKAAKIEEWYKKDTTIVVDDDDKWIFGLFYYDKNNKRLNVEKRVGIGSTINMAHPVGKVLGVFIVCAVMFTLLSMVWLGFLEVTPIHVYTEDGKVICHQLRDEYVFETNSIKDVTLVEDLDKRSVVRNVGTSMPGLTKGNFNVDQDSGCRLFLNPDIDVCIRIETDSRVYYVSNETEDETLALYKELKNE
ncbi:MAG: hypothetical protein IKO61_03330 [Lachnospiraceae bacterium]|nr:hypothetical protein [Lachnospiraceae bacterium]